jgi:hypothetical protein
MMTTNNTAKSKKDMPVAIKAVFHPLRANARPKMTSSRMRKNTASRSVRDIVYFPICISFADDS